MPSFRRSSACFPGLTFQSGVSSNSEFPVSSAIAWRIETVGRTAVANRETKSGISQGTSWLWTYSKMARCSSAGLAGELMTCDGMDSFALFIPLLSSSIERTRYGLNCFFQGFETVEDLESFAAILVNKSKAVCNLSAISVAKISGAGIFNHGFPRWRGYDWMGFIRGICVIQWLQFGVPWLCRTLQSAGPNLGVMDP